MWVVFGEMGQQPNFLLDEASIAKFYHITNKNILTSYPQTQSQGIALPVRIVAKLSGESRN